MELTYNENNITIRADGIFEIIYLEQFANPDKFTINKSGTNFLELIITKKVNIKHKRRNINE